MKHLSAMNIVREISPNTYSSSAFSDSLTETKYRDGIVYTYVSSSTVATVPPSKLC